MSVDAVGAGAGFDLGGGVAESSDLGSLLSPAGDVGANQVESFGEGSEQISGAVDFETVMLAAASLCGEAIAEVSGNGLVAEDLMGESDAPQLDLSDAKEGVGDSGPRPDFGFGVLPPGVIDWIQSATPAQISELCSNIESGVGLNVDCSVPYSGAPRSGGVKVNVDGGRVDELIGQEEQASQEELLTVDCEVTVGGLAQRVVGRTSDVIPQLSEEIVTASRVGTLAGGMNPPSSQWSDVNREAEIRRTAGQSELVSASFKKPILRSTLAVEQTGSLEAVTIRQSLLSGSLQDLSARYSSVDGVQEVISGPARADVVSGQSGVLSEVSSMPSAVAGGYVPSPVITADSGSMSKGLVLQNVDGSVAVFSQSYPLQDVFDKSTTEPTLQGESDGGRDSESLEVVTTTQPRSNQEGGGGPGVGGGGEAGGRESGGRGGRPSSPEPSLGWHGRKVVTAPLVALGSPRLGDSLKASVNGASHGGVFLSKQESGVQFVVGGASEMTAFSLVQRSVGFYPSAGLDGSRVVDSAPALERLAGEVWTRLADSVARVRADRGSLKVEIDLPQGLSVEVELRGSAGGVNAVFRVGDSGLRQSLESMWSVLPRSEKVSALDLADVSFERGAERGFTNSDSRGDRQHSQRGQQERFEGDVRELSDKSSEKSPRLGTPEAFVVSGSPVNEGFPRANPNRE